MDYCIIPLIKKPIMSILWVAIFLFFTTVCVIGLFKLELGLDQTIVLPSDSQVQDYFKDLNNYGQTGALAYLIMPKLKYHEKEVQVKQRSNNRT